jgi:signal transduction histidine kinase/ActR/RegA family two-component response regulator
MNDAALEGLSREFALACDAAGVVLWRDERCARSLAIDAGSSLYAIVAPGTKAKLRALIDQGRAGPVRDWEVALVLDGAPTTLSFNAMPGEGGVLMMGHVAPRHYLRALDQLSESMQEVMSLNREVVAQKKELQRKHDEVVRLHGELTEAHQGVLAMHAELEDRASQMARLVQVKTRIVADAGHELRTPLHGILVFVRVLLDGIDGALSAGQAEQVRAIRTSAEDLLSLVDDLLDLSEAEFGKSLLRVEPFTLPDFAASIRGMLRPLGAENPAVRLVFEEPPAMPVETDRTKLAQIVRNLVSNALKFTERGEVRIVFDLVEERLRIAVKDTGIGIAAEDHERVFEEFAQIDSALRRRVKGSGLGLALSRRLARRLGGDLRVESAPGCGSTFTLDVPAQHPEGIEMRALEAAARSPSPGAPSVLVVEDDPEALVEYGRHFQLAGLHLLAARTVEAAREVLRRTRPAAIILDIMLDGEASWAYLAALKSDPATRDIPLLVVTVTHQEPKARALGADEFWVKPVDPGRLVERLRTVCLGERPKIEME